MRKVSRNAWLVAGFDVLASGGIEALRVEPLAARLGVTKGSFYHHFADRRALHLALLDEWEQQGTSAIIDEVEQASVDPAEQLRRLAHVTATGEPAADAIENGIRAWAATDEVAAAAAARVDERRLAFTTQLLVACGLQPALAERRARLFYRVLIGEFLWRSAGGPEITAQEIDEAVDLLLEVRGPTADRAKS